MTSEVFHVKRILTNCFLSERWFCPAWQTKARFFKLFITRNRLRFGFFQMFLLERYKKGTLYLLILYFWRTADAHKVYYVIVILPLDRFLHKKKKTNKNIKKVKSRRFVKSTRRVLLTYLGYTYMHETDEKKFPSPTSLPVRYVSHQK